MHALATAVGTANLQTWIKGNVIPLLLLILACSLFMMARSGNNKQAMKVVAGAVLACLILGIAAVPTAAPALGRSLIHLVGIS
jgi:magnesium-transporting ATPase (P-type)